MPQSLPFTPREVLPFPPTQELPSSLDGAILDFLWDVDRLHALSLPAEPVVVAELAWHLDLPYWRGPDGRLFAVSPVEVRSRPARHDEQFQRTMRADLAHPIHIVWRTNHWVILDGIHRLLKADMLGWKTIEARRVPESALADIAVTG